MARLNLASILLFAAVASVLGAYAPVDFDDDGDASLEVAASGVVSGSALLQSRSSKLLGEKEKASAMAASNATEDKWEKCAFSAIGLVPEIVSIGISFSMIEQKCKPGAQACKTAVDGIISQIISLTQKITGTGGIVGTCSGEDNACAAKITADDGPVKAVDALQKEISSAVFRCEGKRHGIEMYQCLGMDSMLKTAMGVVQALVDAVHECKRNCKPVDALDGCRAQCHFAGASHSCTDRVKYLYGNRAYTLKAAIDKVNYECCHACVCSQADFADLDDCDKPCHLHGSSYPCSGRVEWVFKYDWNVKRNKQASIDRVNRECKDQCSCSIGSKSLDRI